MRFPTRGKGDQFGALLAGFGVADEVVVVSLTRVVVFNGHAGSVPVFGLEVTEDVVEAVDEVQKAP